jgi:NAD(P)-dependent dehydrogenase (short-subunit alcohol dehydrogenase family)
VTNVEETLYTGTRLADKVVLVSGAARGMGAAEARVCARAGAAVVLGDVRASEGVAVADEIVANGGRATFVHLDVTAETDWENAVGSAVAKYGALHGLVNNAAIWRPSGVEETTLDVWNEVVATNQTGTFLGMRAAIPALRRSGRGSIVNVSSVLAFVGTGNGAAYHATKGAVHALMKTAAIELAPDGIRVNTVHPGAIDTPMADEALGDDPAARTKMLATHPLGRMGNPEEVALAVLYLLSDESSFVTGAELVIDGGNTAW